MTDPLIEPRRAGQYLISDAGSRSYDGATANGTIDIDPGTVVAVRTSTGHVEPWNPAVVDPVTGLEHAVGVIDGPVRSGAGDATKRVTLCVREAEVDFEQLTIPDGADIADVRAALPKLVVR